MDFLELSDKYGGHFTGRLLYTDDNVSPNSP